MDNAASKHKISNIESFTNFCKTLLVVNNNNGVDGFTVRSVNTGKEYTFTVKKNKSGFVNVSIEMGYLQFKNLGWYYKGSIFHKCPNTHKTIINSTNGALSIAFVLNAIENNMIEFLFAKMGIYHMGRCCRCGRTLTTTKSIEDGLGAECARKSK